MSNQESDMIENFECLVLLVQDSSFEVMVTMTCGENQSSLMTPLYWPVIVEEDEWATDE